MRTWRTTMSIIRLGLKICDTRMKRKISSWVSITQVPWEILTLTNDPYSHYYVEINQSMKNFVQINMFACDHCEYQVASKKVMEIHNRTFHDENAKYNCDICGHQVSHKRSLVRHKKIDHE